jgi:hypothetical protein
MWSNFDKVGNGCVCLCYFKGDLTRLLFQDITSLFVTSQFISQPIFDSSALSERVELSATWIMLGAYAAMFY